MPARRVMGPSRESPRHDHCECPSGEGRTRKPQPARWPSGRPRRREVQTRDRCRSAPRNHWALAVGYLPRQLSASRMPRRPITAKSNEGETMTSHGQAPGTAVLAPMIGSDCGQRPIAAHLPVTPPVTSPNWGRSAAHVVTSGSGCFAHSGGSVPDARRPCARSSARTRPAYMIS